MRRGEPGASATTSAGSGDPSGIAYHGVMIESLATRYELVAWVLRSGGDMPIVLKRLSTDRTPTLDEFFVVAPDARSSMARRGLLAVGMEPTDVHREFRLLVRRFA